MSKMNKINPKNIGVRLEKKLTRVERLEKAVHQIASLPQFLLQEFQVLLKTVEDIRFTYEIIGQILQEKGVITQEELTEKGNTLIEERKKSRKENLEKIKDKVDNTEEIKGEISKELMNSREDLVKCQIQDTDISIKEIK